MSDVGKSAYLTRRKGSASWYYRRRLPPEVVAKGAKPDFWLSLRTSDHRAAQSQIAMAEERYWEAVAKAQGKADSRPLRAISLRAGAANYGGNHAEWYRDFGPRLARA